MSDVIYQNFFRLMFLRKVNLLNHMVTIHVESDIFVMPANLKVIGRRVCKWLKMYLKQVFAAATYSYNCKKWTLDVNANDIDFINQFLSFTIKNLFLELECANCQLTLFIYF